MKQPYVRSKELGTRLEEARKKKGWSVVKLAKESKVDAGQLSKFLSQDFSRLSPKLSAVCELLKIDPKPFMQNFNGASDQNLVDDFRRLIASKPKKRKAIQNILLGLKELLRDKAGKFK